MRRNVWFVAFILEIVALAGSAGAQAISLRLDAGGHERGGTPVRALVTLPESLGNVDLVELKADDGSTRLGQLSRPSLLSDGGDPQGTIGRRVRELHFLAPDLERGASARFSISKYQGVPPEADTFEWRTTDEGDLLMRGEGPALLYVRPVLDESTPEARELTFKPFHHLFSPDGRRVTKGPGGLFTHHRGLFFGYNRISYGQGKEADVWHARGKAYQSHLETLDQEAGPIMGRHRVRVGWHGQDGERIAVETREVTVYATEGGRLIDFAARVESEAGDIRLDGDPQHAGVHVRVANYVADVSNESTYYLRPDGKGGPGETRNWEPSTRQGPTNLPWNAMSFVLPEGRYTVAYLDHPRNPKEARFSERDYGRFGSYFEYDLRPDRSLEVRYRLWLQPGEMSVERVATLDADFDDPPAIRIRD